ncbi:hypothetical protein HWC54_gp119 [Klebsiella phage Marfa]|uniref:Uncharacterized protein n=1 Tax=Klebsiella phage Marfa TaxID=2587809 RepID=A0A4Y5TQX0_9CAUD|nr:hypothetical protein HWC54_gp119 [Klebsiella phage Marfa]QDB71774.1 hypothetical protein CPT_Marfa_119 [Klebsiella phage Marfa]
MTIYRNEYDKDANSVRHIDPRMAGVLKEMAEYKEYSVEYPQTIVDNCSKVGSFIGPFLSVSLFLYCNWTVFTALELVLLSALVSVMGTLSGLLIGGAIGCGIARIIAGFRKTKHDKLKQQQAKDAEFANWIKGCRK